MDELKCESCGTVNPKTRELCVKCHQPLQFRTVARTAPAAYTTQLGDPPAVACVNCGSAANALDAEACGRCNTPLGGARTAGLVFPWGEVPVGDRLKVGASRTFAPLLGEALDPYDTVSGVHAEVYVEDGELFVRDLGSKNGTFLNDRRLAPNSAARLGEGDRINFSLSLAVHVRLLGNDDG